MEEISKAYPSMDGPKIDWVNIEKASNGYIVSWDEKETKEIGCMEHCDSINKKKLFSEEEEDEAWSTYVKYKKLSMKKK